MNPRLALFAALLSAPAFAVDFGDGRLSLNGFGSWEYGITNHGNYYLAGAPGGDFTHTYAGLNVSGQVTDRLKAVVQFSFHENRSTPEFSLDYGFAEYAVSDSIRLRAGQVKQPFGISGEVFNIGTLRPFLELPQSIYGAVGFQGLSYKGVGITGSKSFGDWTLGYDLYGGGTDMIEFSATEQFLHGEAPMSDESQVERERTRYIVGGRLNVQTPFEPLRFGVSAYQGFEVGSEWRYVIAGHAEYAGEILSARAEFAHETVLKDLDQNAAYLEVAARVGQYLQFAAQGNWLHVDYPGVEHPIAPTMKDHLEAALGVNFWITPSLVVKASVHRIWGNRLAAPSPADFGSLVATGGLHGTTNLLLVGTQFSF